MEHHERREFNFEMAQTLGRIEEKLDSLGGPTGRVTKLEDAQKRHWWFSYVVTPALFIGHTIARQLGARI